MYFAWQVSANNVKISIIHGLCTNVNMNFDGKTVSSEISKWKKNCQHFGMIHRSWRERVNRKFVFCIIPHVKW